MVEAGKVVGSQMVRDAGALRGALPGYNATRITAYVLQDFIKIPHEFTEFFQEYQDRLQTDSPSFLASFGWYCQLTNETTHLIVGDVMTELYHDFNRQDLDVLSIFQVLQERKFNAAEQEIVMTPEECVAVVSCVARHHEQMMTLRNLGDELKMLSKTLLEQFLVDSKKTKKKPNKHNNRKGKQKVGSAEASNSALSLIHEDEGMESDASAATLVSTIVRADSEAIKKETHVMKSEQESEMSNDDFADPAIVAKVKEVGPSHDTPIAVTAHREDSVEPTAISPTEDEFLKKECVGSRDDLRLNTDNISHTTTPVLPESVGADTEASSMFGMELSSDNDNESKNDTDSEPADGGAEIAQLKSLGKAELKARPKEKRKRRHERNREAKLQASSKSTEAPKQAGKPRTKPPAKVVPYMARSDLEQHSSHKGNSKLVPNNSIGVLFTVSRDKDGEQVKDTEEALDADQITTPRIDLAEDNASMSIDSTNAPNSSMDITNLAPSKSRANSVSNEDEPVENDEGTDETDRPEDNIAEPSTGMSSSLPSSAGGIKRKPSGEVAQNDNNAASLGSLTSCDKVSETPIRSIWLDLRHIHPGEIPTLIVRLVPKEKLPPSPIPVHEHYPLLNLDHVPAHIYESWQNRPWDWRE